MDKIAVCIACVGQSCGKVFNNNTFYIFHRENGFRRQNLKQIFTDHANMCPAIEPASSSLTVEHSLTTLSRSSLSEKHQHNNYVMPFYQKNLVH